jgi:hypothetical protein
MASWSRMQACNLGAVSASSLPRHCHHARLAIGSATAQFEQLIAVRG